MNNETSPDTDQSPESPPTSPESQHSPSSPDVHKSPIKPTSKSPSKNINKPTTLRSKSKTPKSPKSPKSSKLIKSSKSKLKAKNKSKSKQKQKPTKDGKENTDKNHGKEKSKKSKTHITNEKANELLAFLANKDNPMTERYNAAKRIHPFILHTLTDHKSRINYATKFLSNHDIEDDKIRGILIDFMCKFSTSSKFDGIDPFTVIIRPFTQQLVNAIQGKKTLTTIKRIVYGFAQIYPVMLARLCKAWKGNKHKNHNNDDDIHSDNDDDIKNNNDEQTDYSKTMPKYKQCKAVYVVSEKIVDNILLLLPAKAPQVRDYAIKFAKSMILHTTSTAVVKNDGNKFSLLNIREGHPLLNKVQLTTKAKAWLKALTDALNKPRKLIKEPSQRFTKENCENAIKGLISIAKERPKLRTPVVNSLQQWVADNHDNHGADRLIYKHCQHLLKNGFKHFLLREDSRQLHKVCMQALKQLTLEDQSEYREIQKQYGIFKKKTASNKE